MVSGKPTLAQDGTSLSTTPQIALAGRGYWGKIPRRNFHALVALASVVDATENGQSTPVTLLLKPLFQIMLTIFSEMIRPK